MSKHDPIDFESAFGAVIDDVLHLLERLRVPYMLIGGLAVAVRAEPRATKDIDLSVLVAPDEARQLITDMATLGFRVTMNGEAGPGAVIRFVRTDPDGIERWVDVLCAGTSFEEQALERASMESLLGRSLPVVTVEDLVILKLLAARPQDWADIDALFREHAGRLDEDYIDGRASEWEIEELVLRARGGQAANR